MKLKMLTAFINIDGSLRVEESNTFLWNVSRTISCNGYQIIEFRSGIDINECVALKNFGQIRGRVALVKEVDGKFLSLDDTREKIAAKIILWYTAMKIINSLVLAGEKFHNCKYDCEKHIVMTCGKAQKFHAVFDLKAKKATCYRTFRNIKFTVIWNVAENFHSKYQEAKKITNEYFRSRASGIMKFEEWMNFLKIASTVPEVKIYLNVDTKMTFMKFMDIIIYEDSDIDFGNFKMSGRTKINSKLKRRMTFEDSLRWSYGDGMKILLNHIQLYGMPEKAKVCSNGVQIDEKSYFVRNLHTAHTDVYIQMCENGFETFAEPTEGAEKFTLH